MTTRSPLPTDIHSLKNVGIQSLEDIRWPVSDDEYLSFVQAYLKAYEEVLLGLDPEIRGILIADFAFVAFLSQASHAEAVIGRVRETGGRVEVGPLAQSMYRPDWEKLSRIEFHDSHGSRMLFRLRAFAKDLKSNDPVNLFRSMTGGGRTALGVGSLSRLRAEYAREHGICTRNAYMRNLLPSGWQDGKAPLALAEAADGIVHRLGGVFADKFGFHLDLVAAAATCWKRRLGGLYKSHNSLMNRQDFPEELLVTETARPLHRIVAASFRATGRRAVGFHHGNATGGLVSDMLCYNELSTYNVFVCPTRVCAESYANNYSSCRISKHQFVHTISTESEYYKQLHQSMTATSLPGRIENVMLMGFPMNAHRYYGVPGYFFLFQLDLEMRLARLLKQNGYKVLYKIHPERQEGVRAFLEPLCDKIISDPFEQCWSEADALLFKYTASSTFGFALCTNRPIVLLDHERRFWRPEHYEELARRCRMVPASMGDDQVRFDEEALLETLKRKPHPPEDGYVRKFMYPHGNE